MATFTVLGSYDDNGETFCETVTAEDAYTAMKHACRNSKNPNELCIIGVIQGEHELITPGCDNKKSAYALDLADFED